MERDDAEDANGQLAAETVTPERRSRVQQVTSGVGKVGGYLKEQRLAAHLSLRQLADLAGVSNPYLSQIERGLRKPSAEVLQQIARALRISAEQLYVQAGLIGPEGRTDVSVEAAILADTRLTAAQRQSLLEIHASFIAVHAARRDRQQGQPRIPEGDSRTHEEEHP